ncbi:ferritin-like domain-containing protein [Candidatus Electronema sp. TJ]|uniref:ferritin-like domain-containing protein n=1 Tax=Candidatus Electronema sp. TJ TaxID=3401573 RepID=UPI003AA7B725
MATWTKQLVQEHAQVAAAIELYTVPFYTTVMTSIKDENSDAYKIIRGVLIEEMMHLQLAANLCVVLDTTPNLGVPDYEKDVPSLLPGTVLNADMGPLNADTLKVMLAIEKPEQTLGASDPTADPNIEPKYPYSSIGEMYDALLAGIMQVGENQFSWSTERQQTFWGEQGYPQIIRNYLEAKEAVAAIKAQGEGGHTAEDMQPPFLPEQFKVDLKYQMINKPPASIAWSYQDILYKEYSHFSRFLRIQDAPLPEVYQGTAAPDHPTNIRLRQIFNGTRQILDDLNDYWTSPVPPVWMKFLGSMRELSMRTRECWKAGVIPYWGKAA